jgi:hypothetical protein
LYLATFLTDDLLQLLDEVVFGKDIADVLPHAFGREEAVVPHYLEMMRYARDAHIQTFGDIRDARFFILEHETKDTDPRRISGELQESGLFYEIFARGDLLVGYWRHGYIIIVT